MALARLVYTLDCAEPEPLAQFWATMLDGEIAYRSDQACAVRTEYGWLAALRIDDYIPPTWPDPRVPKQTHLDVAVPELDSAEAKALRLGATKPAEQPAPDRRRILLDPAGHPFCLVT